MTSRNLADVMEALPPAWASPLPALDVPGGRKLVVLDDDPTGTQTVYDIPVLTEWSVPSLTAEFANDLPCFYILTNSRSLGAEAAAALNREIAENLVAAASGREFDVVSRSDSTLRGHFPLETDVLTDVLGPYDGVLLVPYFEAGGRYTIGDVHYVADKGQLVPAADTPFAADATFGYRHSNLREWVEEKTNGKVLAETVRSLDLEMIRQGGPNAVAEALVDYSSGTLGIVNAAAPVDLEVVVSGIRIAQEQGKRFLYRTGAQFVSCHLGLRQDASWEPPVITSSIGGLVVVGSHVPKSTKQLERVLASGSVTPVTLEVAELLAEKEAHIGKILSEVNQALKAGGDVVLYTSRKLIVGADADASLAIAREVSSALVAVVQGLEVPPRYLIGKGGITSSDLASRGLGVRRAMVLGPLLPGVPVWETDETTRFPGMPYVVFPGNVGDDDALLEAIQRFRS